MIPGIDKMIACTIFRNSSKLEINFDNLTALTDFKSLAAFPKRRVLNVRKTVKKADSVPIDTITIAKSKMFHALVKKFFLWRKA